MDYWNFCRTWRDVGNDITTCDSDGKDMDRMEEAIISFKKMETELAVIKVEVKNINKKLDGIR